MARNLERHLDDEPAVRAGPGGEGGVVCGRDGADDREAQAVVAVARGAAQPLEGFEELADAIRWNLRGRCRRR
ncbi:hypothetical protein GCM10010129_70540 [Streptomyces fumigatiscleroticus]|nr:hypothetical protein GCM10010129_70540 [Streptomyces fumigatiscleroticus]